MKRIKKLIGERTATWDPAMIKDPVQDRLLDIISAKKKGRKKPAKAEKAAPATPNNVVNIMDALRKSLGSETKRK